MVDDGLAVLAELLDELLLAGDCLVDGRAALVEVVRDGYLRFKWGFNYGDALHLCPFCGPKVVYYSVTVLIKLISK